jgi:rhodanese-related sulfurtransferase
MKVGAAAELHLISASELDELLGAVHAGRVTLVDVLSPESYAAAHIDGAINLPVAEIAARAGQLIPDRARPIVVYCGGPT